MSKASIPISGRMVAITGGARGLGLATANELASRGARVAIGDLDGDLARDEAVALPGPGPHAGHALDVTNPESFEAFLNQAAELGPLDVLINNAGIMPLGVFAEEDDATARRMVDINLHGVIYGMKLAIPAMQKRGSGHIVNLASQAGKIGLPGGATYCATKHAVVGLSQAVRAEVFESGIEVSVVMPSVVKTELGSGLQETPGVKQLEPEHVADAIVKTLKFPKFEVWVPAASAVIDRLIHPLPLRAKEAIGRLMKVDKVLAHPDRAARAAYEERAAHSKPGLEPEEQVLT